MRTRARPGSRRRAHAGHVDQDVEVAHGSGDRVLVADVPTQPLEIRAVPVEIQDGTLVGTQGMLATSFLILFLVRHLDPREFELAVAFQRGAAGERAQLVAHRLQAARPRSISSNSPAQLGAVSRCATGRR